MITNRRTCQDKRRILHLYNCTMSYRKFQLMISRRVDRFYLQSSVINPVFILSILQLGQGLETNRVSNQYVLTEDLSGYTCFLNPTTCTATGATMAVWLSRSSCQGSSGVMSSVYNSGHVGFMMYCSNSNGKML